MDCRIQPLYNPTFSASCWRFKNQQPRDMEHVYTCCTQLKSYLSRKIHSTGFEGDTSPAEFLWVHPTVESVDERVVFEMSIEAFAFKCWSHEDGAYVWCCRIVGYNLFIIQLSMHHVGGFKTSNLDTCSTSSKIDGAEEDVLNMYTHVFVLSMLYMLSPPLESIPR